MSVHTPLFCADPDRLAPIFVLGHVGVTRQAPWKDWFAPGKRVLESGYGPEGDICVRHRCWQILSKKHEIGSSFYCVHCFGQQRSRQACAAVREMVFDAFAHIVAILQQTILVGDHRSTNFVFEKRAHGFLNFGRFALKLPKEFYLVHRTLVGHGPCLALPNDEGAR